MATFTVIVIDSNDQRVFSRIVDTDNAGTNADESGLTDIQKALHVAGPDVCPWDCDHCRE